MDVEVVRVKQPYEAPAVVELGSFATETALNTWGNISEVQYPYVFSLP
ncbi:hypothetical protein HUW46_08521 [Amycolatopsis sp. CA-230715]|nr:hypothetical protein HUW46_08521 [Amycolatopsis sp. CA-230715]